MFIELKNEQFWHKNQSFDLKRPTFWLMHILKNQNLDLTLTFWPYKPKLWPNTKNVDVKNENVDKFGLNPLIFSLFSMGHRCVMFRPSWPACVSGIWQRCVRNSRNCRRDSTAPTLRISTSASPPWNTVSSI